MRNSVRELLLKPPQLSGPVDPGDPYWDQVSLSVPGRGTNGSITFVDLKGHTLSIFAGSPVISTAIVPDGAILFNPGDMIDAGDDGKFQFGTGDFTVEWSAIPLVGIAPICAVIGTGNTSDGFAGSWMMCMIDNNSIGAGLLSSGSQTDITSPNAIVLGIRKYYAYSRTSGVGTLFEDGAIAVTAADTNTYSNINRLMLGDYGDARLHALINDYRVTKGVGRYTAPYTPTVGPFPTHG